MTRFELPPIARRWRFAVALAGVTALAGGGVLLAAPSNPTTASAFHPMVASRVLDTREGTGPIGVLSTIDVLIPGLPDDATAISVNVTAVDGTEASYVTVYAAGAAARPINSTVNWDAAGAVANSATVVVNPDHMVRVFNLKGTVNVVIDLLGYYAPTPVGGGTNGTNGTNGLPGAAGAAGAVGAAGTQGIQGPLGPLGSQGPIGSQGPVGPVGPEGPVGPGVYLFASNTMAQNVITGNLITFDTVGATLGGISDGGTGSVFTVGAAGVYKVSFGVLSETESQVDILINGSPTGLTFGALDAATNAGTSVLTLASTETISLGNWTSGTDLGSPGTDAIELTAVPVGGTGAEINAWILIEQLSA